MQTESSPLPVFCLIGADERIVASTRAANAVQARDRFKAEGLQGVRVTRAKVAPADPDLFQGPRCETCGEAIQFENDYRLVSGWERIHRGAGGTNAIRCPDRTAERFMCRWCVDKLAAGVSPHQQALAVA